MTVFAALLLAFVYRVRGGGFIALLDFEYKLFWGLALALSYLVIHGHHPNLIYSMALILFSYASLAWVPHAYCQNMGRWPVPQVKWPSIYMPTLTTDEWLAIPPYARTIYDFLNMAGVGLVRGLIVFMPFALCQYALGHEIDFYRISHAIMWLVVGQPVAYLLGWYVPFTLPSLKAKSTEWCELFNGAVYALCLFSL